MKRYTLTATYDMAECFLNEHEDSNGEWIRAEDALREQDALKKALIKLLDALEIPERYQEGEVGEAISEAKKLL